jgi:hypothetical protein
MKINVGNYELVYSGSVICINDITITMVLPDPIEGDFTIKINFIQDITTRDVLTRRTAIDKFTLQMDFVNFKGHHNIGNTELMRLGTLKHQPLFFNYRVADLENVGMTLTYNFYIQKEVNNG